MDKWDRFWIRVNKTEGIVEMAIDKYQEQADQIYDHWRLPATVGPLKDFFAAALRTQGQRIEKLEALLGEIKELGFHDHSESPRCSMCDIEKAIAELEDK